MRTALRRLSRLADQAHLLYVLVFEDWGDAGPGQRVIFTAEGTLNREDWGLTWNMPLDGGGLLVSRDIRIEIEAEALLEP